MSKRRDYCFTINNYTEQDWFNVCEEKVLFGVYAKEVGESGTPHIQGYFNFINPRAFSALKKTYPTIHLEEPKGSAKDNLLYIQGPYDNKKGKIKPFNEDAIVVGVMPLGQGKRTDLDVVRDLIQSGSGMKDVVLIANSYQSVKMAECILKYHEKKRDFQPIVKWFYGSSGSGKTKEAINQLGEDYFSPLSYKWWEGYDAHENVLLDDIRCDFCSYDAFLRLIDRYAFRVETKGGSRQFLAKHIIITSPYSPEEIWSTHEDKQQLLRRITEIKNFN